MVFDGSEQCFCFVPIDIKPKIKLINICKFPGIITSCLVINNLIELKKYEIEKILSYLF